MGNRSDVGRRTSDVGPHTLHSLGYSPPTVAHQFARLSDADTDDQEAPLAAEVPVALVYNARPHVVMMCTPADLEDFGVGFTLTEGIVATRAEIARVETVKYSRGVELQIEIPVAAAERLAERGRAITGRTGCGLCGVEVIDEVFRSTAVVRSALSVPRASLWRAGEALADHQPFNRKTNAIHAAAWATPDGTLRVVREDVGRHNALDKVLGALARAGTDASQGFVVVTSRASYELVQKVAASNVPLLAAVSRPSALAVQLADDAGIALVGLLRGNSANVYTHRERIA